MGKVTNQQARRKQSKQEGKNTSKFHANILKLCLIIKMLCTNGKGQ
jgi:hypothetical protein